jgi:Protein of unknown function (DUF2911)
MKNNFKIYVLTIATVFSIAAVAQKPASPAAKAEGKSGAASITIEYSQPSAKGRKIMGGLVPFGEVWRTGANATTSIEFGANVTIEGQAVAKGKYGLFTIPGENEWTIIINQQATGSPFDYSDKKDVVRVKVKPAKTASFVETFTISVENNSVVLKWENTQVAVGVKG